MPFGKVCDEASKTLSAPSITSLAFEPAVWLIATPIDGLPLNLLVLA